MEALPGGRRDNDRAADAMGMHPGSYQGLRLCPGRLFCRAWPGPCTPTCGGGGLRILHPAPLDHLSGHGHRGRPGHTQRVFLGTGPPSSRWSCRWNTLAEHCRPDIAIGLESGHGLETLFFWPGDRSVFDVRTAGIANWWRIVRSYTKLWPFRITETAVDGRSAESSIGRQANAYPLPLSQVTNTQQKGET
jgi:hypothetical protein